GGLGRFRSERWSQSDSLGRRKCPITTTSRVKYRVSGPVPKQLSDCDHLAGRFSRSDRAAARSLQAGELLSPAECRDLLAAPDFGVLDLIERVDVQSGDSHGRVLEDRGEPVEELPRVVAAGFDHARKGRCVLAQ